MTPEKIKEYTELLEQYIKESVALPFIGSSIILSTPIATELLELLKSIRYVNLYTNPCDPDFADIMGSNHYEHIGSAIWEAEHSDLEFIDRVGVIKLT